MQVTIQVPGPNEVPLWAWITAGAVAWYLLAALVVRTTGHPELKNNPVGRFFLWAFSPIMAATYTAWFVLSRFTSCFLVGSDERKEERPYVPLGGMMLGSIAIVAGCSIVLMARGYNKQRTEIARSDGEYNDAPGLVLSRRAPMTQEESIKWKWWEFNQIGLSLPWHDYGVSVSHNPHKNSGVSISEYLMTEPVRWVSDEHRMLSLKHDEIWVIKWLDANKEYVTVAASDMASASAHASRISMEAEPNRVFVDFVGTKYRFGPDNKRIIVK